MLPKFLYGSYKRYNSDTDQFTEWLVETAEKCRNKYKAEPADPTAKGPEKDKALTSSTKLQSKIFAF